MVELTNHRLERRDDLDDLDLPGLVHGLAKMLGLTIVSDNGPSPTVSPVPAVDRTKRRDDDRLVVASHWIAARKGVSTAFDGILVLSPGWDLLLELYVKQHQQPPLSLKALCLACHAPQTTALRWIRILEERGLIARHADQKDGRRWFVELTDDGLARMHQALDASLA